MAQDWIIFVWKDSIMGAGFRQLISIYFKDTFFQTN